MIKTESGEMIEPRVGDVVLGEDGEIERITKKNIDAGFIQRYCLVTEQDYCLLYKNCTLLHRPFEYGDIVIETDLYDRTSEVVEWGYYQQSTWDFQNEPYGTYETHFEHKQESWRDHSEWSGA